MSEAIQCYDKSLALNSRDAVVWTNKGMALFNIGKVREAIQCYDKALSLQPNNKAAAANRQMAVDVLASR